MEHPRRLRRLGDGAAAERDLDAGQGHDVVLDHEHLEAVVQHPALEARGGLRGEGGGGGQEGDRGDDDCQQATHGGKIKAAAAAVNAALG